MSRVPSDLLAAIAAARGRVPVTRLPDGRAEGAGDLSTWAGRRFTGKSGMRRRRLTVICCGSCGYSVEIDLPARGVALRCMRCRSTNIKTGRTPARPAP